MSFDGLEFLSDLVSRFVLLEGYFWVFFKRFKCWPLHVSVVLYRFEKAHGLEDIVSQVSSIRFFLYLGIVPWSFALDDMLVHFLDTFDQTLLVGHQLLTVATTTLDASDTKAIHKLTPWEKSCLK